MLDHDSGTLAVQTGRVAFQSGSREFVYSGRRRLPQSPRLGPGLPYFEDASDLDAGTAAGTAAAIDRV